jgi:hypothetical protein
MLHTGTLLPSEEQNTCQKTMLTSYACRQEAPSFFQSKR